MFQLLLLEILLSIIGLILLLRGLVVTRDKHYKFRKSLLKNSRTLVHIRGTWGRICGILFVLIGLSLSVTLLVGFASVFVTAVLFVLLEVVLLLERITHPKT